MTHTAKHLSSRRRGLALLVGVVGMAGAVSFAWFLGTRSSEAVGTPGIAYPMSAIAQTGENTPGNASECPTIQPSETTGVATHLLVAEEKQSPSENQPSPAAWRPLFNGKDLEGWTPKIRGYPFGQNYANTFRVENGVLKVVYDPDKYPQFHERFGHLFYKEKFSHYRLRVEYRFVGEQCAGGPGWAFRNSGIMLHCQDPRSMALEQSFPVSIEVQLLGGRGTGQRPTANLCTPGTHVVMDGKLFTPHCTDSRSKTYHGDQWVCVEVEVHGSGTIRHYVEGQLVLEYEKPQLDDRDPDAKKLLQAGADRLLSEGYIALQSESHPVEFRKVEIMLLEEGAKK